MCGLVGVAGTIDNKSADTFWNLLIFSQVRGMTSTGIAAVDRYMKNNNVTILKDVGVPTDLCGYKAFDSIFKTQGKSVYIGHNRAKTVGESSKKNAHPFMHGDIVGAHNGTLHYSAKTKLEGKERVFDTDSEGIFYNLDVMGIDDTLEKLEGAWALTWYNTAEEKLYVTRNTQRELFYCYSEKRKQIFWASEYQFLEAALPRNNIKYDKIYTFKANHIYSWKIPKYDEEFEKPTIVAYPEKKASSQTGANHSTSTTNSPFARAAHSVINAVTGKPFENKVPFKLVDGRIPYESLVSARFAPSTCTENNQGYIEIGKGKNRHYKGYKGNLITKKTFESLACEGCAWCNSNPEWGTHVEFISDKEYICSECLTDQSIRQYLTKS